MIKETKIIIGDKGTGKTTYLIKESAKTGRTILVANVRRADIISQIAKHQNVSIPYPITLGEWLKESARFEGTNVITKGLLIDDLDAVIEELFRPADVKTITISTPQNVKIINPKQADFLADFIRSIPILNLNKWKKTVTCDADKEIEETVKEGDEVEHEGKGTISRTVSFAMSETPE